MIKSMTGFASATREHPQATVSVSVRAVNHRFLDAQVRLPQAVASLEPDVRAAVQRRIARGRLEVNVTLQQRREPVVDVEIHERVVAALAAAFDSAREKGLVSGTLTPGDLMRVPQAVTIRERLGDADNEVPEEVRTLVREAVEAAIESLDAMRAHEGGFLAADLEERRRGLVPLIDEVERLAAEGRGAIEARLARRVQELQVEASVDPALIAQEIVKMAARVDISEELTRFRAHLEHWHALANADEPCGRKFDFLLQEINREINTIGSKSEAQGLAERIVQVKAELEKMREQVQNVE
ncbi:MAG: YicC family protein [Vicinamibacteraceae bacterium]|nr:YicC family protein [Vicinamibacteraceae bacterium]